MKKYFLLFIAVLLLTGCASSDRMMRLSPASANSYRAPNSIRLRGKAYQNMQHVSGEKKKIAEENVVNVWPLFLKNDYFHSILWPFIDYDKYGVAVRPFYNKEGDEHSILFPLAGWNSANGSGWVFNTFWSKDFLRVFPFYAENADSLWILPVSAEYFNDKDKTLKKMSVFPFYYFAQSQDSKNYYHVMLPFGGYVRDGSFNKNYGMILNTYWGDGSVGAFPLFHWSDTTKMFCLAYAGQKSYGFIPLFAQNFANDGGYFFPLYAYSVDKNKSFVNAMLLFNYSAGNYRKVLNNHSYKNILALLVYSGEEKKFKMLSGSANSLLFNELDKQCIALRNALEKSNMKGVADARKNITELLTAMKINKDFAAPQNIEELETFAASLQHKFGTEISSRSFSILPFFNVSQTGQNKDWSLLFGLLHKNKSYKNHDINSLPYNSWKNKNQIVEEESSRTFVVAQSSENIERNFKRDIRLHEQTLWSKLHSQVRDLANCIEQDEFNLWKKDPKYKSLTAEHRTNIQAIADKLGITLPELKTSAQCHIYRKEIEGMCLDYFKVDNTSMMPFFEMEESNKGSKFEIFPFYYTENEKVGEYGKNERTNVFMLCHNQTVKDKIPQGKLKEVFKQLEKFEASLVHEKVKHELPKALRSANLAYAMPKNYRECHELRKKLYALIPENTERISTLLPFYFYKSNSNFDDSYLNILGIFYNGGHNKKDSWFNVLGILSRGFTEGDEEEFRILEFLYRSRKRKNEKDYLIFPFIYFRESGTSSQFSFLHRIINIEKSKKGTKGHIFYIPFGD